ncbi:MAG: RluA family pseudouridine synthase [Spirochaetota bacterium]
MNTTRIMKFTVSDELSGKRIDLLLSGKFSYKSRTQWQDEIKNGNISINGAPPAAAHRKVASGDVIEYHGDTLEEPPVDRSYTIIYRDPYVVAVNKPGDLPTHPSGIYYNNTLSLLLEADTGEKLIPLHRLDRETSGVILFARENRYVQPFHGAMERARKEYTALARGNPEWDSITVNVPLGSDHNSVVRKKRAALPHAAEKACTRFTVAERYAGFVMVRAFPETGRLHQIRVHLLHLGHPILGDKLYGGDESWFLHFITHGCTPDLVEALGMPRSALHAEYYTLPHPFYHEEMTFHAPLPEDMKEIIQKGITHG